MSGIVGKNLGRGSGVVKATPVADESVDSDAYVDASIDNAHLADDAVDSDELAAGSVDNAHLADDAVNSDELAAGAVDLAHMSADSVDSPQYVDASIDTAHIATNQIDETLMKDAFVGDFTDATVTASDYFLHGDATASGNTKKDTVQGVIDLVHGATVGVQTIWIPAIAMYGVTTNPPDAASVETTAVRPELKVLDFDAGTAQYAQFVIAMPTSWNRSTITFKPYWVPASTNTGNCIWGLQAVSFGDSDPADVVFGTVQTSTDAGIGTLEDVQVGPESSAITVGGTPLDEDITFFQIYRDAAAGGDTFSADARLLGVKIFFTTNAENDD